MNVVNFAANKTNVARRRRISERKRNDEAREIETESADPPVAVGGILEHASRVCTMLETRGRWLAHFKDKRGPFLFLEETQT